MGEVASAVEAIRAQIAILHDCCDDLDHPDLIGLLAELSSVVRAVPALEHRVLARLMDETEPARLGEASWRSVLTTALRVTAGQARTRITCAQMLASRRAMTGEVLPPVWEATAAALAEGSLSEAHVAVIARFHRQLPSWVDAGTHTQADAQLADLAAGLRPEELAAAAAALGAMIDQDGPEPTDAERARKARFTLGAQQRDGMSKVSGYIDPECRALLEAGLATTAAPGAGLDEPRSDPRSPAQRNHDGLKTLARAALESGRVGSRQGLPTTVIVSTTLQELEAAAGVAVTGGGTRLPMTDLIQMAAPAHHYLYIYHQHTGQSLYLARTKRLASAAQRIVLHAKDRGCTKPGCTVPGYWCQAHHLTDWKHGGHTDIDDLTFACGPDNRLIDNTGWSTRKNAQGRTEWLPPPDLDTGQARTNNYHHPQRFLPPDNESDDSGGGGDADDGDVP